MYRICRTDRESGQPFHDRQYIYYANASYQGSDAIGRLMHDFLCSDPDKMQTSIMAEAVRYYKNNPKGVATMCRLMEEMQKEYYHRAEDQTLLRSIRNIMDSLNFSAIQAMDVLKISKEDRSRYMELLLRSN